MEEGDLTANFDLTEENINPNLKRMNYIIGGTVAPRATEIEKELAQGKKFPFTEVIRANVGDLQGLGGKPITFYKQVIALVHYPELMKSTNYPDDVKQRAKDILDECESRQSAAYTSTEGLDIVRTHIADKITRRDGVVPAKKDDIILGAASTNGVRVIFKLFADQCNPNTAGIMFSIPLYSLFSASAAENGIFKIGFYATESKNWEIELSELNRALAYGRIHSVPRAIFIINPVNPTGAVLTRENIEVIIKFANRNELLIVADEVYQDNIYTTERPFVSFRKVLFELGNPYDKTQMISVYSTSKGFMGEAGVRGGYIEMLNLDKEVRDLVEKSISTTLMPSVLGQALLSCHCDPPKPGSPSYSLYMEEKTNILTSLAHRAKQVRDTLNGIQGITSTPFYGAMSIFPNVVIPMKAIKAARDKGQTPDVFYAYELLENTGICVIPGSDFGERRNTYHFRISNLPQPVKLAVMLEKFKEFHPRFLAKYS